MNKRAFTKRILTVALSLIMVLGLMPMTVFADGTYTFTPTTQSGNNTSTIQYSMTDENAGDFTLTHNSKRIELVLMLDEGWYFEKWDTYFDGYEDVAILTDPKIEGVNPKSDDGAYTFFNQSGDDPIYDEEGPSNNSYYSGTRVENWEKDIWVRIHTPYYGRHTITAVLKPILTVIADDGIDYRITTNSPSYRYLEENQVAVKYGDNATVTYSVDNKYVVTSVSANYNTNYSENGTVVTVNSIKKPATVTIRTRLKQHNVVFNANGGEGTMSAQVFEHSVAQTLTENNFRKTGYTFTGWNTKADGTGTAYADKQSVSFAPVNDGDSITLYAQWTACTNHQWENGECTKCGAVCSHSGGTATCTEKATCSVCGMQYGEFAKHNVVYSASQNRIVETCTVCDNHIATADLVRDENVSTVYNGNAIEALKVNYSDNWQGDDIDIVYFNNINAGTASGTISIGGATATQTFEITAANICGATVTLDPTSGEYTGNPYTPNITVTLDGFGTLVKDTHYTFSWDNDGFTAPDTYTVRVVGIDNFTGYVDKTFTINAASLTDVKVEQVGTLTYNGEALTPIVSANAVAVNNQPVTFTYSTLEDGTYGTLPSFDKAGSYTVYYKATAPNHNEATGSFTVTVDKATVTVPTITDKVYNGTVQTADVPSNDLYTVVENNGGTGVKLSGYYDVVLELKDAVNYKWSSTDDAQVTLQFTITRATNEWTVTPSISGWTYGETAKTPVGTAKFGDVSVEYSGTANDGTQFSSMTAPTRAGNYTATFIVAETEDYSGLETSVDFTIEKADQAAPTGLIKTDTTYFGKADGKISGLTSAMEFRKEGDSTYTAGFNGTLEYLSAGTYYVRYQGDANHNPSLDAVVTVNAGRKLQIVVPQNQIGYTVTVNKTEMEYEGSYTLKVEIHEGYTATEDFKIIISNWECGQQAGVEETYTNAIADQIIEVQGVADITAPAAEIKIENNKWSWLWNDLTFGLFFKETQDVTITATDKGSGVKSIEYYLAGGELELDEVLSIKEWVEYNGAFKINPNNRYVVYAKIVDNAGNTVYVNSDGIVLDDVAPTLEGIENGKTYYGDLTVIKSDEQFYDIKIVTLDGEPMGFAEGTYGLIPADNAEHTVVVEDHAGNKTTYTVTVMKNYTVTYRADGEIVSTETVGHGKDATLPAVPAKAGYTGKWDHDGKNITSDIVINAVYTENSASASPQTGDNSNMFLWIALLFISGGAIITLTVVDRKRRTVNKR